MNILRTIFLFLGTLGWLCAQPQSHVLLHGEENYFCSSFEWKRNLKKAFLGKWDFRNDSVFYTPSDTNILFYNQEQYYVISPRSITLSIFSYMRYLVEDRDCEFTNSLKQRECLEERTMILQWMDRNPDYIFKNGLIASLNLNIVGYVTIQSFRVRVFYRESIKIEEFCQGNSFSHNVLKTMFQYDPKDVEIVIDQVQMNLPRNHLVVYPQTFVTNLR